MYLIYCILNSVNKILSTAQKRVFFYRVCKNKVSFDEAKEYPEVTHMIYHEGDSALKTKTVRYIIGQNYNNVVSKRIERKHKQCPEIIFLRHILNFALHSVLPKLRHLLFLVQNIENENGVHRSLINHYNESKIIISMCNFLSCHFLYQHLSGKYSFIPFTAVVKCLHQQM